MSRFVSNKNWTVDSVNFWLFPKIEGNWPFIKTTEYPFSKSSWIEFKSFEYFVFESEPLNNENLVSSFKNTNLLRIVWLIKNLSNLEILKHTNKQGVFSSICWFSKRKFLVLSLLKNLFSGKQKNSLSIINFVLFSALSITKLYTKNMFYQNEFVCVVINNYYIIKMLSLLRSTIYGFISKM